MALTIRRRKGEAFFLKMGGDKVKITFRKVLEGSAVLSIEAPRRIAIWREELETKNKVQSQTEEIEE
jgi:sRNA-binding carbon storage regulator CsrA